MMRLLALVLAGVWALAGWRNLPQLDHGTGAAAGFVMATSILLAFWAGTRLQRDQNRATAVASAEATAVAAVTAQTTSTAAVNVNVFTPNDAARASARHNLRDPLENAPWLQGAHRRPDLDDSGDAYSVALEDVAEIEYQ